MAKDTNTQKNPESKNSSESKESTETPATWILTDIIPKTSSFNKLLDQIKKDLNDFKKIKTILSPDLKEAKFQEILNQNEELAKKLSRLGAYIGLRLATNIQDKEARAMQSRYDSFKIQLHDETMFLGRWIKGLDEINNQILDDKNAKRLFKVSKQHEFKLNKAREAKLHTLTENEEKIIHRKDSTGISTVTELYDMFTNDFTYKFTTTDKKTNKKTTKEIHNQGELLALVHSQDPEQRKAAYQSLFTEYKKHSDKLFLIYSSVAKDWAQEAKLRNYKESISMRNFANNIPDKAIETLLQVCQDNIILYHKFFKAKAKELYIDQNKGSKAAKTQKETKKLSRYDLYAPMQKCRIKNSASGNLDFHESTKKIPYSEAKKIVLDNFKLFSEDFHNKAKQIIDEKHLDSHPKKNKRSGAFCMAVTPKVTPYVLTNYTQTARDVSTLAHELGHAVHDLYAAHNPHTVMHPPLPLAETASTFAEMIIFEALLKQTKDKSEKRAMLMDKMSDSYATIIRQNYFILFEIRAHKLLEQGCSEEELCNLYMQTLKEQFGDSIEIPEEFRYEWSYIPHIFHSPFYCYAYNFGELLSLALYKRYKEEKANGNNFIPQIEKVLKAGGSQDPKKLLKSINVDIEDKEFWQGGFDIVKDWIKEIEQN